ncbi:MAG: DUF4317 domain-containing protein [Lachnospiraceae bacterium]|nr:DUF4317 domain-containing protein [Lachnospiraceae bacterium]
MDKKSILELKRRMKKDDCTFTRMCGCYVNGSKEKVVKLNETFLNLEDEEYYKYLEIAKKALSGAIGNNMMELNFHREEEQPGGHQQFLMGLKASALKNEELLDMFYDLIIENYDYVGNYLILLFHDAYDVPVKTTDNIKMDESEEVYEYVIVAICPVTLTKPGLGYRKEENRIGTMDRDWMVGMPETGFTFPAFSDRSSDIHAVMFYSKDAKNPHEEIISNVLGCHKKRTDSQKQVAFTDIIKENVSEDKHEEVIANVSEKISEVVTEDETKKLSGEDIAKIMMESGVSEVSVKSIESSYNDTFEEELPDAEVLVDSKVLKAYGAKIARLELEAEVEELKKQLDEAKGNQTNNSENGQDGADNIDSELSDADSSQLENGEVELGENEIVVNVNSEKKELIRAEVINGQKCIIIPVEDDDKVVIKEK